MYDLCVIGGGASGMACAITAKLNDPSLKVIILEKNDKLGRKIYATGNGRCNITNQQCDEFRLVLSFFEKIGVLTKLEDEGRFYPYSQEAKEVVKALEFQIENLGIEIRLGYQVTKVEEGFTVNDEIKAKNLVIATGGKAAPEYGTTGDGYALAKSLGHKVTRLAPALAPIECVEDFSHLKGVRSDVNLTLYKSGKVVASSEGQLQFIKDGLSGICAMDLSREIEIADDETIEEGFMKHRIYVDFMPEMEDEQVMELLLERKAMKGAKAADLFRTLLKEQVALDILKKASIDSDTIAKDLKNDDLEKLAFLIKNWQVNVKKVKGWKNAQVTKGGVDLEEIDLWTMRSNLMEGLFIIGEVMDYDGPCGGFNLQNAWETGIKAGEFIAGV
ncbi:MAG: aminoacetone oxidase family FAD-binding enzyme [Clostridia bacterium]|nr:aminoacetone oxidase family FAD-binding enzyme [Clostridia bacterium]